MDLKGTCNNNNNNNNNNNDDDDVSDGYLLLEATGDSESDCINPNSMVEQQHAYEYGVYNMADVDDAQSCSCDDEFENPAEKLKGCLNAAASADDDRDGKKKKGDFCGNYCCDEDVGMMQEHYKSCVSDDSCLDPVDEVEKSRQFWEACLAS
ncbi:hypothetical protein PIB30_037372 [Stylosanthes scabra]|uniref:GCK domain-containing protein n=1 Tax=Stylosanthes scabra TaxID=79078 RepID=A0ABU6UCE2_9FABA|nr:hypothetical protein [Stylosanthes scabra]